MAESLPQQAIYKSMRINCIGLHQWHKVNCHVWTIDSNQAQSHRSRILVCVHGLSRNGRDFDRIAQKILEDRKSPYIKVVSVDVVGRGDSDWLVDKTDYNYFQYMSDIACIIATFGQGDKVDYLGTSMGALIGMRLAALPNCPIRKLIMNDIGPFVPKSALCRLGEYVGQAPPVFETVEEAVPYFKKIFKPFNFESEEDWQTITRSSLKPQLSNGEPTGKFMLHYDPAIGTPFQDPTKIGDLEVHIPIMLVRGKESDILTSETVAQMQKRGPGIAKFVEFEKVGHAPMFFTDPQIGAVKEYLFE